MALADLDHYERAILRLMYKKQKNYTANEIADILNISWLTVKRHLKYLRKRGYVTIVKKKRYVTKNGKIRTLTYWRIAYR